MRYCPNRLYIDYWIRTQSSVYHGFIYCCMMINISFATCSPESRKKSTVVAPEFRTHHTIPHRRMDQQAEIIRDMSRSGRVWSFTNLADCERYHLGSCEHANLLLFCFILGHLGVDSGFYTAQPEHLQAEEPAEPPEQQEGSGA